MCFTLNHWPLVSHLQEGVKCLCAYFKSGVLWKIGSSFFRPEESDSSDSGSCFILTELEENKSWTERSWMATLLSSVELLIAELNLFQNELTLHRYIGLHIYRNCWNIINVQNCMLTYKFNSDSDSKFNSVQFSSAAYMTKCTQNYVKLLFKDMAFT